MVLAHDVFISYSSKDKATADAVCHTLEQRSIRCWIAPRDVPAGTNYGAEIIRAIRECSILVLVFSGSSNASQAVWREVQSAFTEQKALIPLRIEDVTVSDDLGFYLSGVHWLDAYPNQEVFGNLLQNVAHILKKDISGDVTPANNLNNAIEIDKHKEELVDGSSRDIVDPEQKEIFVLKKNNHDSDDQIPSRFAVKPLRGEPTPKELCPNCGNIGRKIGPKLWQWIVGIGLAAFTCGLSLLVFVIKNGHFCHYCSSSWKR